MSAPCVFEDRPTDTRCVTHDVQAEPRWPDAMNAELVCPVATDPGWRLVHGDEEVAG